MCHVGVVFYIQSQCQSVPFSILRGITNALSDRLYYRMYLYRFSIHPKFHTVGSVCTKNASHQFCSACSHQAGNAKNLSLPDKEMVYIHSFPTPYIPCLQRNFPDFPLMLGIFILQGASYDHVDKFIHGNFIQTFRSDILAIPDYRNPLTYLVQFCHTMRNIYHSYTFLLQSPDNAKKLFNLPLCQGCRRLIQHQDFGLEAYGLGDLYHLLLCHT